MPTPTLRSVSLNALRAFEAAARLQSFALAAQELGVTATAISHQVRRLEERIGRRLFVRSHRAVKLSPAGQKLAGPLSDTFAEMERIVAGVASRHSQTIEVSALPSFAATWLAPRLASFRSAHPQWRVRVAGADHLVDFSREAVDVGIRYGSGSYPGLHVELLTTVSGFPVCSPTFKAAHGRQLKRVADLRRLPLLHDESSLKAPGLPTWAAWFRACGVSMGGDASALVFESAHMAQSAAEAGQGVALGLSALVDDSLRAGRLVRLFDTSVPSVFSFWIVCRPDQARTLKVRRFTQWLHAQFESAGPPT